MKQVFHLDSINDGLPVLRRHIRRDGDEDFAVGVVTELNLALAKAKGRQSKENQAIPQHGHF